MEEEHHHVGVDDPHAHSHHEDLGPVAGDMMVVHDVIPEEHHEEHHHLEDDNNKRPLELDLLEDEESKKRQRKNAPPPKKLNEDQWAEMFSRLVKYKELHGVSSQSSGGATCRVSTLVVRCSDCMLAR
jgi:hypothetical protein